MNSTVTRLNHMPRVRRIKKRKVPRPGQAAAEAAAIGPGRFEGDSPGGANRVVVIGERVFALRLARMLNEETDLHVVATASTPNDAIAAPNEHRADLVVIDIDFGGVGEGVAFARAVHERSPDRAFMLVCGAFTTTIGRALWVYGTDSWSIISQATAKSPAHFAEAVDSAVRGMNWVEPGIARELRRFGPRPPSLNERRLAMFAEDGSPLSA